MNRWAIIGRPAGTKRLLCDRATRGNQNDVWYSADGENWRELPGTPWKPRHAASVFVYDDALWMVAGNNMQPDVWKLIRKSIAK